MRGGRYISNIQEHRQECLCHEGKIRKIGHSKKLTLVWCRDRLFSMTYACKRVAGCVTSFAVAYFEPRTTLEGAALFVSQKGASARFQGRAGGPRSGSWRRSQGDVTERTERTILIDYLLLVVRTMIPVQF